MTMNPFAGPMSPRTQGFAAGGPQGAVSVEDAFTDGFTQMAYDTMGKANPSLMRDVITFRALDADPEEGSGLGTFILAVNQEVFYAPVVVADNTVKPIDMFYSRRLNRYFPLTPEWIAEANKSALNELGQGVAPPKGLQSDVDISRVVEPPMTGRYGYAMDKTAAFRAKVAADAAAGRLDGDAKLAFRWALKYEGSAKRASVLPTVLAQLPNAVKVGFARALKARPALLRKMAGLYGVKSVTAALQPRAEKRAASEERPLKRDVFVASLATPVQEMKRELGEEAGRAYAATRLYGFYAKDRRGRTGDVMLVENGGLELVQPKTSGVYRVYTTDGKVEEALVLVEPREGGNVLKYPGIRPSRMNRTVDENARRVAVVFRDGRCIERVPSTFVAEPVMLGADDLRALLTEWTVEAPANGDRGMFVYVGRGEPVAVAPMKVSASRSNGSERRYDADWGPTVVVTTALRGPLVSNGAHGGPIVISGDFRWLKLKDEWTRPGEIYTTPEDVLRAAETMRVRSGSKKVAVKQASRGTFYVGADPRPLPLAAAVEKVASAYGISLPATLRVFEGAVRNPRAAFWTKTAADDAKPKKKSPPADDGGEDPAMTDPAMMDPAMMAPPAPPPPSGYELAIAEQLQLIQSQIAALNDKAMTLQQLQSRQQQIDGGGGMMAAPTGAASLMAGPPQGPMGGMPMAPPNADPSMMQGGGMPMDPSMMQGGGMPMDPSMGGMPSGMDPSMMQGGMPPQGMPPGMDPSMMQGGGMPMDPSMGGMPMDPSMMQGGGMPMDPTDPAVMRPAMTSRDLDAGTIEQAINPAFLDVAADLDQADVFDAAAIASLAQNKNLRSVVQSHLPRAEETLDNIGRMKLLFDLREAKIKQAIGNDTYTDIAQNLRDVFSQLGDLLLKLNQTSDQLLPPATG